MKVEAFVSAVKELEFAGITLLSEKEYEQYRDSIPKLDRRWWLRSPGYFQSLAAAVRADGSLSSDDVSRGYDVVRPALRIWNLESSNLKTGDKFYLAGERWTIISDEYVLCDSSIGYCCFREDFEAADANDFDKSDVKLFIEQWAEENGIKFVAKSSE